MLFSGNSHTTLFLTPNLKKNVKTYVVDKERQKEIFSIMKDSKKRQKQFVKIRKKYIKESTKLNTDRSTTREQYNEIMPEYFEARQEIHAFSISNEMAMKNITTEEEWNNIVNAVLKAPSKSKVKDKATSSNNKNFNRIIQACEKIITDKNRKDKALQAIDSYRNKVDETLPFFIEWSYKDWESIRDYDAKKEDYEAIDSQLQELRNELWIAFLDTRFQLLENTNEMEWKQIIKDFNRIIKFDVID